MQRHVESWKIYLLQHEFSHPSALISCLLPWGHFISLIIVNLLCSIILYQFLSKCPNCKLPDLAVRWLDIFLFNSYAFIIIIGSSKHSKNPEFPKNWLWNLINRELNYHSNLWRPDEIFECVKILKWELTVFILL